MKMRSNQKVEENKPALKFNFTQGKVQKKKLKKKLTSVSFMYVCVAENGEMLVFFSFFSPTIV